MDKRGPWGQEGAARTRADRGRERGPQGREGTTGTRGNHKNERGPRGREGTTGARGATWTKGDHGDKRGPVRGPRGQEGTMGASTETPEGTRTTDFTCLSQDGDEFRSIDDDPNYNTWRVMVEV